MKADPKSGDIGIYTLNGLRMEVRLEGEFNRERSIIEVFGSENKRFFVLSKSVQWDKQIELVDKPIVLDPSIDWHNDLDQESLQQGYRPLIKGEDKEEGDEYFDGYWEVLVISGPPHKLSKYRTKRPLSDFLDKKKIKLTAKIKDLEKELKEARQELKNI